MNVKELKIARDEGKPMVLIDVREPREWEFNRIEGAVHLPLSLFPQSAQALDPDTLTVIYCHHGMRSAHAVAFLRQRLGFSDAHNLEGGIDAWSREIDPKVPIY